ncbi:hypothetical protein HZH68_000611 [Vespula germanica]|uniref:Uncharacterized protein n=1 Tax=Vespula germanica TaxID=30212 RepID=A0A834NU34_VESGE|nr:hypothetical protein HZH68_000611 [Vespula germanica]
MLYDINDAVSINQHVVGRISVDVNPNDDRLEKARKQQTDRPTNRNRKLVGRLSKFVACVLANRGGGRREGLVKRDPPAVAAAAAAVATAATVAIATVDYTYRNEAKD